jgi:hypothetical protein
MECEMNFEISREIAKVKKVKKISLKSLCLLIYLFSYSFQVYARTVLISDIDDTIKKSNSMGTPTEQAYHFSRKIPYLEMRDFFNEIKMHEESRSETIKFYYVSAARTFTFDPDEWLHKHRFPQGPSLLKKTNEKRTTYDFKYAVIKKILLDEMRSLKKDEAFDVLMFGDNAKFDANVYNDLKEELHLNAKIYIRDVRAVATYFDSTLAVDKILGPIYYFSEVELFKETEFYYLSPGLIARTYDAYKEEDLLPAYTLKTLNRRLESLYDDKNKAKVDAIKYWNDYYSKF